MQRIAASDYYDITKVSNPRLSPDGDAVAYLQTTPEDDRSYGATVHVAPVEGDESRRFTAETGSDSEPRWGPDGDRLAFVSTRGEDGTGPELWVVPTDGGEAERVTTTVGGVSQVTWSPDGTRIAFVQQATAEDRATGRDVSLDDSGFEHESPDPRVIDRLVYRSDVRDLDGRRSHVYVVEPETGEVERLTDGDYDFRSPEWAGDGTLYYRVKRTGDPDDSLVHDVVAHDLRTDETETVTQVEGMVASLAATEDGRVACQYMPLPDGVDGVQQHEVDVFDRTTGEVVRPTASLDRTAQPGIQWGPDREHLYFLTPDEGRFSIWRVAADASTEPERIVTHGKIDGFDVGADTVAYTTSEWDHPNDVFVATAADGEEPRRLTRVNADYLGERLVSEPEELRFESADGHEIQGWVLTPPDFDPDEQYPLVVEIHGGPTAMWTTSGTMWHEFQMLAARGYVVFWSNPRGSTGYGREFMTLDGDARADTTMQDVLAGADLVCDRDYVDPENQFVAGGSFGGFMTVWLVSNTDRFSAATPQRGSYDPLMTYASSIAFKYLERLGSGPVWDDPDGARDRTVADYGRNITTPTLVMHSEEDYRVPVTNADLLFRLLKKRGVDTRFVRYPREGHELSRSGEPGHVVDRLERIVRWFDGYSDHHDVPRALDRGDDGLSVAVDGDDD